MGMVYCEFCGVVANDKVRDPRSLVEYLHARGRSDVVRCWKHRRTSKLSPACRTHDALTGERKG